jgi:hypothetical protein
MGKIVARQASICAAVGAAQTGPDMANANARTRETDDANMKGKNNLRAGARRRTGNYNQGSSGGVEALSTEPPGGHREKRRKSQQKAQSKRFCELADPTCLKLPMRWLHVPTGCASLPGPASVRPDRSCFFCCRTLLPFPSPGVRERVANVVRSAREPFFPPYRSPVEEGRRWDVTRDGELCLRKEWLGGKGRPVRGVTDRRIGGS